MTSVAGQAGHTVVATDVNRAAASAADTALVVSAVSGRIVRRVSVGNGLTVPRVGRVSRPMIGRAVTSAQVAGNGRGVGIVQTVLRESAASGPIVRRVGRASRRVIGRPMVTDHGRRDVSGLIVPRVGRVNLLEIALATAIVRRVSVVSGRIVLRVGRVSRPMIGRAVISARVMGNGRGVGIAQTVRRVSDVSGAIVPRVRLQAIDHGRRGGSGLNDRHVSAVTGRIVLRVGRVSRPMIGRAVISARVMGKGRGVGIVQTVRRVRGVSGAIVPRVSAGSGRTGSPLIWTNRSSTITTNATCLSVCGPS